MSKPFSQACTNNQQAILDELLRLLPQNQQGIRLLEVGSGTGQHGVYFASRMPQLEWFYSDRRENHDGISVWLNEAALPNLHPPLELDVLQDWPVQVKSFAPNVIYSANTAHIMAWPTVEDFFTGVASHLSAGGLFILYGPFNYAGQFSSESNARFDRWLKEQNTEQGIRDMDSQLLPLAKGLDLSLVEDIKMPANNRLLVWRKS